MAIRPVFCSSMMKPFYQERNIEFTFFSGFSVSQKQKSIDSLHEQFLKKNQSVQVLEVSSKSKLDIGIQLSAFNLKIKYRDAFIPVECAFQGSKKFELGGPYQDLYFKTSYDAKKDMRLHESGKLIKFVYDNVEYPLEPKDIFYNWIYINALHNNAELANQVIQFDSFTDIEFNPKKSINCQARAVAIYVGLVKAEKIEEALLSFDTFKSIVYY